MKNVRMYWGGAAIVVLAAASYLLAQAYPAHEPVRLVVVKAGAIEQAVWAADYVACSESAEANPFAGKGAACAGVAAPVRDPDGSEDPIAIGKALRAAVACRHGQASATTPPQSCAGTVMQ
jgi:hypothetical protein